jgi:hypothetical protein
LEGEELKNPFKHSKHKTFSTLKLVDKKAFFNAKRHIIALSLSYIIKYLLGFVERDTH